MNSDKWRNYGRSGGNCCLELIGLADHKEADCVSYSFLMRALLCEKRHDVPIRPNRPMILPKTSTIRIFTNMFRLAASARAAVEPVIPTETLRQSTPEQGEAYTRSRRLIKVKVGKIDS